MIINIDIFKKKIRKKNQAMCNNIIMWHIITYPVLNKKKKTTSIWKRWKKTAKVGKSRVFNFKQWNILSKTV